MLAYTRMLYLPNAIDKMGSAMETAIKKKIEPKKTPKKAAEVPQVAIESQKITKKHIEALASSIRAVKRDQKPLEANKVYIKLIIFFIYFRITWIIECKNCQGGRGRQSRGY